MPQAIVEILALWVDINVYFSEEIHTYVPVSVVSLVTAFVFIFMDACVFSIHASTQGVMWDALTAIQDERDQRPPLTLTNKVIMGLQFIKESVTYEFQYKTVYAWYHGKTHLGCCMNLYETEEDQKEEEEN